MYFHDIRREEMILNERQPSGGSVLIWGTIGFNGRSKLTFISAKMG